MAKANATLFHVTPPGLLKAKARKLTADIRSACSTIEQACSQAEGAADELAALGVRSDPEPSVGGVDGPVLDDILEWLDRQRLLGLISADGIATVEKLIAEVG